MIEYIKILGFVILVMVLIELMDFPEWLGTKLRGGIPNKKIKEIDKKINELEEKVKKMQEDIKNKE